jgi:hypothetical protein
MLKDLRKKEEDYWRDFDLEKLKLTRLWVVRNSIYIQKYSKNFLIFAFLGAAFVFLDMGPSILLFILPLFWVL